MKRLILLLLLLWTLPAMATTWYVNANGGTRYSTNVTTGQCNGQSAAAYPGSGVNQNCAFGDIRYLWADGSYTTGTSFPGWGWVGASGDTYLIDCPNDCRVGYSGPNSSNFNLGIAGNPFGSGAPVPPSGTVAAPTNLYGINYANCTSDSAKAHINGGYGAGSVLNLRGASYVNVACLDITDHSSCGRAAQTNGCSASYPLSDYASNGIVTNNTTTHTTITDVRIHGMASAGMLGPTGTGVSLLRVALVGNASSGWNMDAGDGTTGTGTLSMNYFSVLWNGCAEEYPIVDSLPYQDCTDDNSGGYGDGIGTATVTSNPAWLVNVNNSVAAYNTQDGFDLLHLSGNGSSLTITNSTAYSNMGQQLKVGAAGIAQNNILVGNCNALRQAIPGTPTGYNSRLSDFCRAADTAVLISVSDNTKTIYQFNTLYSANATGVEIDCSTCTGLETVLFENNIFLGFPNDTADGYPGGGTGNYANPIYVGTNPFTTVSSLNRNNVTYHYKSNWTCPATWVGETNAMCLDPQLTDETWPLYGIVNMTPIKGSRVIGAGLPISGVTTDNNGYLRPTPPSIGALEFGSHSTVDEISATVSPDQAGTNEQISMTAMVSQTGSVAPTGTITFLNGSTSLGTATLGSSGTAIFSTSTLPVGSYAVVASYSGDANYPQGTSSGALLQVQSGTTTALAASSSSITAGNTLTLTASVGANGSLVPNGSVNFLNGSTLLGTATLNSSGLATLSTTSLAAGTAGLTAKYVGNSTFLSSTSSSVSVLVNPTAVSTTTSLVATPNPVSAGSALSMTATVKGTGTAIPMGSVNFLNGSTLLGTATLNASGTATLSTTPLAMGTLSLKATYVGTSAFLSSTSGAVSVVVNAAAMASTTSLIATPSPVTVGKALVLTATVKGVVTATPSGTVNFLSGTTLLGSATLNSSGVATLSTTSLAAGSYSLTAKFVGSTTYLASTSAAVSVVVNASTSATTTSLAASSNPVKISNILTLTATVKGTGTAAPTGTINFLNGTTLLGSATLNSSGMATLPILFSNVGTYTVTAQYVGTTAFLSSTSAALPIVASTGQVATTMSLATPNPVFVGNTLTLTATATALSGTAKPSGMVNFFCGSQLLGSAFLNSSGVATLSVTSLSAGSFSMSAQLVTSTAFGGSTSAPTTVVVHAIATATTKN